MVSLIKIRFYTKPLLAPFETQMVLYIFLKTIFFRLQNLKKGLVAEGSDSRYTVRTFNGCADLNSRFFDVLEHSEAFLSLQNLFCWFCASPIFLDCTILAISTLFTENISV